MALAWGGLPLQFCTWICISRRYSPIFVPPRYSSMRRQTGPTAAALGVRQTVPFVLLIEVPLLVGRGFKPLQVPLQVLL